MGVSTGSLLLEKASERFRYFAKKIYNDRSLLYMNLAQRVAEDPQVLGIAAATHDKAALPNLFFAAVHLLLLNGEGHQLAGFYPTLHSDTRHHDYSSVYPHFRNFALEHEKEIREVMRTHTVQTNEVGRCALLIPAFELVADQTDHQPLNMIEIGSSAGLTLPWDKYHYRYGESLECGDPNSPVRIECSLRGDLQPPIPKELPRVAIRKGIDLSPIDLTDPDSVQWLRALVWPDNPRRATLLEHAVQLAKQNPPDIMTGNALELLPGLIKKVPEREPLCIYHSFTLTFANKEQQERLHRLLTNAAKVRALFLVWLEWPTESDTPILGLEKFIDGVKEEKILARCHSHGEWLQWKAA